MKWQLLRKINQLKNKLKSKKFTAKLLFFFIGISSTIWFLVRVIPKPQRAAYPCMRAAAPIMSAFVMYLLSLGGSVIFFKKAVKRFRQGRFIIAGLSLVISFGLISLFIVKDARDAYSNTDTVNWTRGVLPDGPNNPIGEGWGIFPGRVAWVHNVDATNEFCSNTIALKGSWNSQVLDEANSDAFFQAKNNNQDVINEMADKTILAVGGQSTVKDSWEAIFKSFNNKRKNIDAGYTEGQTIFIKVNNGQAGWAINMADLSEKGTYSATGVNNAAISGTTPATVVAYIRQLVDECGIPQSKIYVGEPMTHVYKSMYDAIHNVYPQVKIMDKENHTNLGRTTTSGWHARAIVYSDKGAVMPDAISDGIMNEMYDADYMINIAALKAHARNGVTLNAKLHFGSHGLHAGTGKWDSFHLHAGLISTYDNDRLDRGLRGDYGMYRVLTDIMGNKKLGLNTVLFVVDGLWGGIEATDMPVRWDLFDFDFPNSLFASQDEVAIESVCIDFLRAEADTDPDFKDRPFFPGVDDYLRQAADKANWAEGITYDPEGDGTEMPASLGVMEHWNNDYDKQYTKNLNPEATTGIELYNPDDVTSVKKLPSLSSEIKLYPNPCTDYAVVNFSIKDDATIEFSVLNASGQIVKKYTPTQYFAGNQTFKINTTSWQKGNYIVIMKSTSSNNGPVVSSKKLVVN